MASELKFALITVTVTSAGTAVQVSSTDIYVNEFTAYNASETSSVYIGDSTVDNTWVPQDKFDGAVTHTAEEGNFGDGNAYNLRDVFVDGDSNGDVCRIRYVVRGDF